jgi:membrane fusion protein, heavy metal efflux system
MGNQMMYCKFILTAAVVLFLVGCSGKENKSQESEEKKLHVEQVTLTKQTVSDIGLEIVPAKLQPLRRELVIPAKLIANQDYEAHVGTLVQGRVSKVLVNLGDHVQRGQELMLVEGVEIGEIKSLYIKAKAQLTYAEGALQRQKSLVGQNIGSQKSLLEAHAEYEKAHAEFIAEDRRIHSIGLNENDIEGLNTHSENNSGDLHIGGILSIQSPIAGIVVERNVVLGQHVDPATTAFKIVNTSTLWIDGQLHEGDMNVVHKNSTISVVLPSIPGKTFQATLLYIGELIDQQTRMLTVRGSVNNTHHLLKPEMFAEMHIPYSDQTAGIVTKTEGVIKDGGEQYVFIAVNDTSFEKRSVLCGATGGELVEIKQGIHVGEKVVSKGAFLLKSELKKTIFGEGE